MHRRTYDEGYQDGYADAEDELSGERCGCSDEGMLDSDVIEVVTSTLRNLRMGYDTPTLREVLEEMERIIENG